MIIDIFRSLLGGESLWRDPGCVTWTEGLVLLSLSECAYCLAMAWHERRSAFRPRTHAHGQRTERARDEHSFIKVQWKYLSILSSSLWDKRSRLINPLSTHVFGIKCRPGFKLLLQTRQSLDCSHPCVTHFLRHFPRHVRFDERNRERKGAIGYSKNGIYGIWIWSMPFLSLMVSKVWDRTIWHLRKAPLSTAYKETCIFN